jgi:AraC family transcriptional regulator
MDYRLVDKPAFCVVGKALRVSTKDGENQRRIPQFWGDCFHDGTHAQLTALASLSVLPGDTMLGICTDFAEDMQEFTYLIAVETQSSAVPEGLIEKAVPAMTWAVFESIGAMPEAIQTVWGRSGTSSSRPRPTHTRKGRTWNSTPTEIPDTRTIGPKCGCR